MHTYTHTHAYVYIDFQKNQQILLKCITKKILHEKSIENKRMKQPKRIYFLRQVAKIMLGLFWFLELFKAIIVELNNFGHNPNTQK